jgi:hypothetical protein
MASPAQRTLNQSSLYTATRPPGEYHPQAPLHPDLVDCSIVAFSAPEIGTHRSATWPGLRVETVEGMRPTPFEYGFRAPWHLLITTEITECHDNKTFVEALPRSALRDFARTLTFVPAGHGLSRFLKPRTPTRTRTNSGIDGSPVVNISAGLNKLAKQISHTVQWAHCLEGCVEAGASVFFELGPGRALNEMAAGAYPDISARSLEDFRTLQGARAWLARVVN